MLPKGCTELVSHTYTAAKRELTVVCVVDGQRRTYHTTIAQFYRFDEPTRQYHPRSGEVSAFVFAAGEADVPLCVPTRR